MEKFRRRECDVERYNRAKKCLNNVTSEVSKAILNKVIAEYETESKIIEWFMAQPHEIIKQGEKVAECVSVMLIFQDANAEYQVANARLYCQLYKENYAEAWRNIGKDYHYISVRSDKPMWRTNYQHNNKPFMLEQLLNQDKLQSMCDELNYLNKNYF